MVVYDVNLDAFAKAHLELVDTVVDNLFEQYVYTVVALRTIAELTNVHTWTQTDVLYIAQVANGVVGICCGFNLHRVFVEFQIFIFGHMLFVVLL